MVSAGFYVFFYAVAAAASALVLAATFVVIGSAHPRRNGIAYLAGFVVGTAIACIFGLILGQAAVDQLDSHEAVVAVLALLLGLALIVVGLQARRAPPRPATERSSRASAILAGLANVGPAATFSMAALLGFGGPKRLVLTFLAMESITKESLLDVEDIALLVGYLVISTVLVSVPVVIVIIAGERAAEILGRGQTWLSEHTVELRVWGSLVIGAALVLDALLRLII